MGGNLPGSLTCLVVGDRVLNGIFERLHTSKSRGWCSPLAGQPDLSHIEFLIPVTGLQRSTVRTCRALPLRPSLLQVASAAPAGSIAGTVLLNAAGGPLGWRPRVNNLAVGLSKHLVRVNHTSAALSPPRPPSLIA